MTQHRSFIGWAQRALAAFVVLIAAFTAFAASNVVEYTYDLAGNIKNMKRQAAAGFAVTGFDPESGPIGTVVTVYGTGFASLPSDNVVRFNGVQATISAADAGSISTTVPSGATTGKISVTVNGATATSSQDFTVIGPGAPTITSFTPASGASGTGVTVTGTNFEIGATTVKLNSTVAGATVAGATSLSFAVPASTASGRITATTSAGTAVSVDDFLVAPPGIVLGDIIATKHLTPGASAQNVAVGTPSKHALVLFDGAAATYYTLQFGQIALSPSSAAVTYKVVKPDNTVLANGTIGATSARPTIHLPLLPTAGTYSVVLSPGTATFNANVRVDADRVMVIDGPAVLTSLDTVYQSVRFVVDATAGQRISIGAGSVTPTMSGASNLGFKSFLPDGTQQSTPTLPYCYGPVSGNTVGNCGGTMVATVAGRYTLVAENPTANVSNFALLLSNELAGTLVADTPQNASWTRVGQDLRYTFSAAAGESLAIDLSSIAALPQAQSFNATVYNPSGTSIATCSATQPAGAYCEVGAATAGTHSVWIDPANGGYGSVQLTLKKGTTLSPTDPPTNFAPSGTGESARFQFTASAGQSVGIAVADLAYVGTSSSGTNLVVYKPDRTVLGSSATCLPTTASGRCRRTLSNLPVTGTYSVVVSGPSGVKVTGNITLSNDITGTLSAGSPQTVNATRSGQNARMTFSGTAGDSTSVKLFDTATTPNAQSIYLYVYKPDGLQLTSTSMTAGGSGLLNLPSLPTTGTYTVLVEAWYGHPWSGKLALDPGAAIVLNGAMPAASSAVNEPLRYRFTATTGQRLEFGLAGVTYGAASSSATNITVYRPDGNSALTAACYTAAPASCESWVISLPQTGAYALVVAPPNGIALTGGTIGVSTPLSGSFVIGDPAQAIAIARPGQTLRYTFSGTAAQLLRLTWSTTVVSAGATVGVSILKPDGSTLSTSSFGNGATGSLDIASLPTTGTYTVLLDPTWAGTMSASMSLVTR